eukprot:scaffold27147_cov30-Tisochrysis_lutea.AAC.2
MCEACLLDCHVEVVVKFGADGGDDLHADTGKSAHQSIAHSKVTVVRFVSLRILRFNCLTSAFKVVNHREERLDELNLRLGPPTEWNVRPRRNQRSEQSREAQPVPCPTSKAEQPLALLASVTSIRAASGMICSSVTQE